MMKKAILVSMFCLALCACSPAQVTEATLELNQTFTGTNTFNAIINANGGIVIVNGIGISSGNLNIASGNIQTASVNRLLNNGTLNNVTLDSAGTGNVLKVNGTSLTATTGSGAVVLAGSPSITGTVGGSATYTSPTLTTPVLGVATGTSLNLSATGVLSTTAQSGSGSLCMTTNCIMVTPILGAASYTTLNGGAITASGSNTIGGVVHNGGALSSVTTINASGQLTALSYNSGNNGLSFSGATGVGITATGSGISVNDTLNLIGGLGVTVETLSGTKAAFFLPIQPKVYTVSTLPSASAGFMVVVSDSTTVTSEGQTCVGSSTHTALAFYDGTQWKCF